jgi:subtilase family serine protease
MPRLNRLLTAAGCLALTAGVAAAPASAATKKGSSTPNSPTVLIQLSQKPGLANFVRQVSDPDSRHYRQYSTPNALLKRFGSTEKSRKTALKWADDNGVALKLDKTGLFGTLSAPTAKLHALFGDATTATAASNHAWTPDVPSALKSAASGVSVVPENLVQTAQAPTLAPGTPIPNAGSARTTSGTQAGCAEGQAANVGIPGANGFTPNQYLTAYGHSTLHDRGLTGKGIRVGVLEIDGFNPNDIQTWAACFGLRVPPLNAHAVGMKELYPPGDETTADLEILTAAAPGVEAIDVYEGNILDTLAHTLSSEKTRPDVLSLSLDGCENNYENGVSLVQTLDAMFAILAGSGTTTLVATGDQGSTPCRNVNGQIMPIQAATYPSTSPYVTAVGATNIVLNADNTLQGQVVWNNAPISDGATSGSQSLIFDRPWWQVGKGLTPSLQNGTTRATPDISALGDPIPGYSMYCTALPDCATDVAPNGGWLTFGGTSAATPLTAGGIVLANEAAVRAGQKPLGLINPLIYKLANGKNASRVLSDVTVGNNDLGTALADPISNGQPIGCCSASKGYDIASGWGSLKIAAFSDAALAYGKTRR